MSAVRFIITGTVQGVFFRAEMKKLADQLGLTGWVKNCDDGSVEVHAEGPAEKLKELEIWCRKGPPAAVVENVIVKDVAEENHESFIIRY
ncbi:acylphosphatase [Candidatus Peregrinibacteria bacterium]|nr:acylphosphatase [Candidatus Peregrinibacteria bacterium]